VGADVPSAGGITQCKGGALVQRKGNVGRRNRGSMMQQETQIDLGNVIFLHWEHCFS